jgi:hypothetical protein
MRLFGALLLLCAACTADTVTLRSGQVIQGSYLGGDARNVRFAVGNQVETYRVDDISSISFGDSGAAASQPQAEPPAPPPPPPPAQAVAAPAPPPAPASPPPPAGPTLAPGTALTIRMIDSVDSERDSVGKTFRASLDDPINDSNGNTLIPRGADVVVKLIDDKQAGKIAGRTVLTLDMVSIAVNGKVTAVDSNNVTEQSASRTARSGKVIGGAAVLGTIIGAVAGGGKGAAIGAASGAGVGTAAEVVTKGQKVHIPSEARLTFTLQQPVALP